MSSWVFHVVSNWSAEIQQFANTLPLPLTESFLNFFNSFFSLLFLLFHFFTYFRYTLTFQKTSCHLELTIFYFVIQSLIFFNSVFCFFSKLFFFFLHFSNTFKHLKKLLVVSNLHFSSS